MQNNNSIYKNKYLKYKQKYLDLQMYGGINDIDNGIVDDIVVGS
jgi:hypothetical protein